MTKKEIAKRLGELYEAAVKDKDIVAALYILDRYRDCSDYSSKLEELYKEAIDGKDYRSALEIIDRLSLEVS